MTWVDLSATLHDAAELYEPVAEENDLAFAVDVPEGLTIWGNRELLSQAVANLLDNAIKHGMPQTGNAARVIEIAGRAGSRAFGPRRHPLCRRSWPRHSRGRAPACARAFRSA